MKGAMLCRKRPCRVCRRWFMPNAKLKERQMTCGDEECQREWHRRKCKAWNKNNAEYFRANYLQKKLDTASESAKASKSAQPESDSALPTKRPKNLALPLEVVQEVISLQQVVIIEYFGQLLIRRFQEALRRKLIVNTSKVSQLTFYRLYAAYCLLPTPYCLCAPYSSMPLCCLPCSVLCLASLIKASSRKII